MTTMPQKAATPFRVRTWREEGQPDAICIRKGAFFIVVDVAEAYSLVNAVHDHAERLERKATR